jgi:hypothetical protein
MESASMADKIDCPGLYALSRETYHGSPTVEPSLSSSGAVTLVQECPAVFWANSPLNPDFVHEQKLEFDIGSAAHLIVLEPAKWGSQVVEIDADNYKTKAAQETRDAAYAAGKTPLLPKHQRTILAMRDALMRYPFAAEAFSEGTPEESFIWKDTETGIWCRARPDWRRRLRGRQLLVDYKTSTSANPREFAKRAWDMGYFQQHPWYCDGVEAVTGERPEQFWFIVQAKTPPYLVTVNRLSDRAVSWGDILNRHARRMFADCLRTGDWHGYRHPLKPGRETAFEIDLPTYAEYQLEDRQEIGEFSAPAIARTDRPAQIALRRAAAMQAPLGDSE